MTRIIFIILGTILIASTTKTSIGNVSPEMVNEINKEVNVIRDDIIELHELSLASIKYCDSKAQVGMAAFWSREHGVPIESVLEQVDAGQKIHRERGNEGPAFIYTEYKRLTKIIYRHPEYDYKDAFKRIYTSCVDLGY